MSTLFGWCGTGHHSACRVQVSNDRGGLSCSCVCHGESAVDKGETGFAAGKLGVQVKTARPGVCTSDRAYDHSPAKEQ